MGLNIKSILGNVLGGSTSTVIDSIVNGADKLFTSKEERAEFELKVTEALNKHNEALVEAANKETELYFKDTDSARQRDINANNSEHAGWLAKNIAPLLAIIFTGIFLTIIILVLTKNVKANDTNTSSIITGMFGIVMMIIGYYFGSSKSSNEKQKQMNEMMNTNSSITIKHPIQ